jgi:mono/diheme cytochrome c family protein
MPFITRKVIFTGFIATIIALVALAGFVWSGIYNIAADEAHSRPVYAVLETLRERSIAVRADALRVPDLGDPARIRRGAGNYDAMCVSCHLSPGAAETELSAGLYPAPPNLSRASVAAAEAFWVIKHGIKASGMPAWGKNMGDENVWDLVAFVQQLPTFDSEHYKALVASSGGHAHGGGESIMHGSEDSPDEHNDGADEHGGHEHGAMPGGDEQQGHMHDGSTAVERTAAGEPAVVVHRHADGTVESHPAPQATPAEHDHDQQHDNDQQHDH